MPAFIFDSGIFRRICKFGGHLNGSYEIYLPPVSSVCCSDGCAVCNEVHHYFLEVVSDKPIDKMKWEVRFADGTKVDDQYDGTCSKKIRVGQEFLFSDDTSPVNSVKIVVNDVDVFDGPVAFEYLPGDSCEISEHVAIVEFPQ